MSCAMPFLVFLLKFYRLSIILPDGQVLPLDNDLDMVDPENRLTLFVNVINIMRCLRTFKKQHLFPPRCAFKLFETQRRGNGGVTVFGLIVIFIILKYSNIS